MKFVYDNGGKDSRAPSDCVVRALAIATGSPYRDVYEELYQRALDCRKLMAELELHYGKNARRHASPRTGVNRLAYEPFLLDRGWEWMPTMKVGSGCQVHLVEDELPMGNLVVRVSKHMTAVIDRVIHDTGDPSRGGTRCVYGYFKA